MAIYCARTRTVYFPVPKVACTSLKTFFWTLNNGLDREERRPALISALRRWLGLYRPLPHSPGAIHGMQGYASAYFAPLKDMPAGYVSFAVVRDPAARLRSAWANRVQEMDFARFGETEAIKAAGLPLSPSFAEFIENFQAYRRLSNSALHHTDHYHRFLGKDLSYFNRIFRLEAMHEMEEFFFERAGIQIKIPRKNRTGKMKRDSRIGHEHVDMIREITASDYDMLRGLYDFDSGISRLLEEAK